MFHPLLPSDLAKSLLALARKGDPDLLAIFEASFDNKLSDADSFDSKFFLENAADIVKEQTEKQRGTSSPKL